MNHYLVCGSAACRFVLDVRLNGRAGSHRRLLLSKCPECGGKWSSSGPLSAHDLGVEWLAKLPHCACCNGAQRQAA